MSKVHKHFFDLPERSAELSAEEKKKEQRQIQSQTPPEKKSKKPQILIREGLLPEILREVENALLVQDNQSEYLQRIYQRSGLLVRVLVNPVQVKGIKRPVGATVIQPVEVPFLVNHFTAIAEWCKFDMRLGKWMPKDCPNRIAEIFLACSPWKVPVLTGIIESPTLRPDGSILEKPGYDEETGLLFHPGLASFPSVPQNPTKDNAFAAANTFYEILAQFPFVREKGEETDFAVILSGILTALIRRALRSAPLHGISAPKAGSGKSLLVDLVSMIATGKRATVISQADSPEEEKKRLLALLMENDLVVSIDNVERPLGSDALCSILTQETWKERMLGQNKMATVLTNSCFFATGNNLTFQGDLSSRALLCRLDPQCEHPEERSFETNLYQYIPEHRGELVRAGLTILRAYHVAGRPKQNIPPYGRFEEWSDWVRSAIVWVGLADPCKSRKSIEESDPVSANLKALLQSWYDCLGKEAITVKELIETAKQGGRESLRDALLEIAGDKTGNVDQRKLGYRLRAYQNRIEAGLCLKGAGRDRTNLAKWRVVNLGA